jgi:hypothetical protein
MRFRFLTLQAALLLLALAPAASAGEDVDGLKIEWHDATGNPLDVKLDASATWEWRRIPPFTDAVEPNLRVTIALPSDLGPAGIRSVTADPPTSRAFLDAKDSRRLLVDTRAALTSVRLDLGATALFLKIWWEDEELLIHPSCKEAGLSLRSRGDGGRFAAISCEREEGAIRARLHYPVDAKWAWRSAPPQGVHTARPGIKIVYLTSRAHELRAGSFALTDPISGEATEYDIMGSAAPAPAVAAIEKPLRLELSAAIGASDLANQATALHRTGLANVAGARTRATLLAQKLDAQAILTTTLIPSGAPLAFGLDAGPDGRFALGQDLEARAELAWSVFATGVPATTAGVAVLNGPLARLTVEPRPGHALVKPFAFRRAALSLALLGQGAPSSENKRWTLGTGFHLPVKGTREWTLEAEYSNLTARNLAAPHSFTLESFLIGLRTSI